MWPDSGDLVRYSNGANRCFPNPLAELSQIQTARRHVPVQRLDVTTFSGRVLQRDVEHDGVDSDVSEREILRGWRLLNEEISLAIPEHGVGASPSDVDVFPETGS